jgi:hypothetical protein
MVHKASDEERTTEAERTSHPNARLNRLYWRFSLAARMASGLSYTIQFPHRRRYKKKIERMPLPFRSPSMKVARSFFDELNREYLRLLRIEGELYWSVYTGGSSEHAALAEATLNRKRFAGDASRLEHVREHLARVVAAESSLERDALATGLRGWMAVLEANAIGNARAAEILSELTALDADLFARRQAYKMTHVNADGRREEASPSALRNNLASNPNESARESSHDALHGLEQWVLENGFVDIADKRNALARELG